MKKILLSLMVFSLAFVFTACDEDSTSPDPATQTGSIVLSSTPAGAAIFLNGVAQSKVTPDSLTALTPKDYTVTLKLDNYYDTTFTVKVEGAKKTTVAVTMKVMPLLIDSYSNIRLYEKAGTGFSGLILSSGTRANSTGATTDLFYDGASGKDSIYSQHLRPPTSTSRLTDFTPGSASNLDDGVDAPAYSSTSGVWKYSMPSTVGNYYFIYDNDFYYSKFKVIARGGGTGASDPYLWVDVSYKYNKTSKDKRF